MSSKKKSMLFSNIQKGIPFRLPSYQARILQMEMQLISSTPIRNANTRNNVDESDQLGSPIARVLAIVNSADVSDNENRIKVIIPSKTNSIVKSNTSAEYKNINNPNNLPGHNMLLYSSDDDDIFIVRKTSVKKTDRKRKVVSLKGETDSDILLKYTKNNADNVENIDTDKADHVQENNKHEKLINTDEINTDKNDHANEISDNKIKISNKESNDNIEKYEVDDKKKLKRKNMKKKKKDDTINMQNTERNSKAVVISEDFDTSVLKNKKIKYSSKKSPKNKINKETTNKKILQQTNLKVKRSLSKALDKALHLSDDENYMLENKKKPKLQSNKKENKTDNSEKDSKHEVKLSNVEQNLMKNVEVKETSQESANGTRKSSRQRIPNKAYWISKSNSQPSNYSDTSDLSQHTKYDNWKEQIPKNTEHKSVPSKTKIPKIKRQKHTKEIITNEVKESLFTNMLKQIKPKSPVAIRLKTNKLDLNNDNLDMNPNDNLYSNEIRNSEEYGPERVTQNQNTNLDSRNNGIQAKVNTLDKKEKQTKRTPVKKIQRFKSLNSSSRREQKNSSSNVDKQAVLDNVSNGTDDINVTSNKNIPSDTLIIDLQKPASLESENNNKKIIDNYSFKEIALAQRLIAEIENSKQLEHFGKFPQTYHTHSYNSNLSIGINISNPNFISGVLEIVPSGKKQHEYPKKNNMFFFVLEGCAEICVGNISKILRIGDSFFVPNNTPYYIINVNNTKRLLLLFTKHAAS